MAFGAYPLQRDSMSASLKIPLLDENGASSEISDELEYESDPPFQSRYRRTARPSRYRSLFTALALSTGAFILGLQSILLWKSWQQRSGNSDVLGEMNGLVPSGKLPVVNGTAAQRLIPFPVGTKPILFAPEPNFDPLNISDPGWERVMPTGGGFVPIPNWREQTLPDPIRTHGKDLYNVAVFHQLHCLHVLAEEFGNLLADRGQCHHHHGHGGGRVGEETDADEGMMMYHIRHCLAYLRDSLTCCADTALEGQKHDLAQPAADGFGARHVCRDFDAVFDWAEGHRGSDQRGYPH